MCICLKMIRWDVKWLSNILIFRFKKHSYLIGQESIPECNSTSIDVGTTSKLSLE